MKLQKIGIWIGFDHKLPIKREGWARVVFYLIKHMLKNYPIEVEIWCYSYNYSEVKELFSELLKDKFYTQRMDIVTEQDFKEGKVNRLRILKGGFNIAKNILLYDRGISWKQPYRYYRSYYPINIQRKKEHEGQNFSIKNYLKYLIIDLINSVIMVFSGFVARMLRKTIMKGTPWILTERYREYRATELPGTVGREEDGVRIAVEGEDGEGNIVYGPYERLQESGYYEVEIHYSFEGEKKDYLPLWDMVFHIGNEIKCITGGVLQSGRELVVKDGFYIGNEFLGAPLEIRVWYKGKGKLKIKKIIINKEVTTDIEKEADPLANLANRYSKSDLFLIPIVTIGNGLKLHFPLFVIMHDLVTLEFYDYFVNENPKWKDWIEYGRQCTGEYARRGAFFCGISNYVIKNQLLRFIQEVRPEQTDFVYHAPMIPDDIHSKLLRKEEIIKKYRIREKYIFYPTQIRPYKNLITILKAMYLLKSKGISIQLVLTGNFEHDKNSRDYIATHELSKNIIYCGDLTEIELYSLYFYADIVVVSSLFEGGFPLQAMEAILMDVPVIVAKIPVTIERLQMEGFDPENCGLHLFNPEDFEELAKKIENIIKDRDNTVKKQIDVKNKFMSYTWDDVSKKYYNLMSKLIQV